MAVLLKERPVFTMGYERSGTTMLMLMIGAHPRIAVPEVTWYYPRFRPYLYTYGNLAKEENFRTLAGEMVFGLMVPFFGLKVNPRTILDEVLSYAPERSFAGIFAAVLAWFAATENKPRWGEKCPQSIFHIPYILQDFPNAQFIFITRDARDSGATYLRSGFGPRNIFVAAELWKLFMNAAQRWRERLDKTQWLDVRYETLVREPETTLRGVAAFLGEEYSPAMLEFYKGAIAQKRGRNPDHYPISAPVTDELVGMHKRYLSLHEQEIFAAVAGNELVRCGYELNVEPAKITEEQAARYRELDMRTRAAYFEVTEPHPSYYSYNEWLIEQWEERRRKGIWSDSNRPKDLDPNALLFMQVTAECRRWKERFSIKRDYGVY